MDIQTIVPSPVPVLSAGGSGLLSPRGLASPAPDIVTNSAARALFAELRTAPTPTLVQCGRVNAAAMTLQQCCSSNTSRLTRDLVAVMPSWERRVLALCILLHGLGVTDINTLQLQTIFPTLEDLEAVLGAHFEPLRQFALFLRAPAVDTLAAAMAFQGLAAEKAPDIIASDDLENTVAELWTGLCVACVRWGHMPAEVIMKKLHNFARMEHIYISEAHGAIMTYYRAIETGVLMWSREAFAAMHVAQVMRRSLASIAALFPSSPPPGTSATPRIRIGSLPPPAKRARV